MQFNLDEYIASLTRTPAVFTALLSGLTEEKVKTNEDGQSWSPFDVVGHLIHGERTDWIPRARIILADGESRPFEPFDRFAQLAESRGKTMADLLSIFAELRAANLMSLRQMQLTPEDFEKTGVHPEFGIVTLGQLLATWAVHDLGHISQVTRTMAKGWRHQVGPWQEYLPILKDRS